MASDADRFALAMSLLPAKYQLRADAKIYKANTITVHDGDEVASFVAAASVTRTATGVTIVDVVSGQTFHFSANATVQMIPGASIIAIPPGSTLPAWGTRAGAVAQ
jgi:hypothetical protein